MVLTLCRVAAFLAGMAAYYISWCLHEDQEGKLQDRVAQLWSAIDDRQKVTHSRATAIFNKVAVAVTHAFDRVFGPRLLSVQLIGVSSSLAFAGLFLAIGSLFSFFLHVLGRLPSIPTNLSPSTLTSLSFVRSFCLIVGFMLFVIGLLPSIMPSRFSRTVSLFPVSILTAGLIQLIRFHRPIHGQLAELAALILSILSDIFVLVLVRGSIRWISKSVHPLRIGLVIFAQLTTVVFIVWAPIEISGRVAVRYGWKLLPQFLVGIGVFNVFTAIAACSFAIILLAVLLHRMFWPAIESLIYPLARYEVVRNHKAMAGLGAICMTFAFPVLTGAVMGCVAWLISVFSGEPKTTSKKPDDKST